MAPVEPEGAMYLTSLSVENVKLLGDQTFSFVDLDDQPRKWTVLVGENGLCKTTILRSIALLASGPTGATRLIDDPRQWVRTVTEMWPSKNGPSGSVNEIPFPQGPHATISAKFGDRQRGADRDLSMSMYPDRNDLTSPDGPDRVWIDELRAREKPGFFIVGYGVGRHLPSSDEVTIRAPDRLTDRLEGLFDANHTMLGTDFYGALAKSQNGGPDLADRFTDLVNEALSLKDPTTGDPLLPWVGAMAWRNDAGKHGTHRLLEDRRLVLRFEHEQFSVRPQDLSQGYQSTIAWITDLIGHALLDDPSIEALWDITGLVLLDELDLHLHPQWQRRLVPTLRSAFPNLQFITTTHSPVVLPSFESHEIIGLRLEGSRVVQTAGNPEPGLRSSNEVLDEFFGVARTARPELVEKERRLRHLRLIARDSSTGLEAIAPDGTPPEAVTEEIQALERELSRYLADG